MRGTVPIVVRCMNYRARSCESVRPRAPTSTTSIGRIGGDPLTGRSFATLGADSGVAEAASPTAIPLRRSLFAHSGLTSPSARRSAFGPRARACNPTAGFDGYIADAARTGQLGRPFGGRGRRGREQSTKD
jgi:hypothetical protein